MATSDSPASERRDRRMRWFVYSVWAAMTLQALAFIIRYADPGPVADEWEFISVLTGEEPFWPWIWALHNEHRFPLPRLIYYPLFQLTGDFRSGCCLSLLGVSLCSLLLISTARRLRGRPHFADAFFPVSLLHAGHWENLRMGYQIVFAMDLLFAVLLLHTVLLARASDLMRRGLEAAAATLLLLGCGAGGLAFGPFMAVWLLVLVAWDRIAAPRPRSGSEFGIIAMTALIPLYVWFYLQGYVRPNHHADPVEVWKSVEGAGWQALRSALQALSTAFGPAAIGLWPASAPLVAVGIYESVRLLLRNLCIGPRDERRRTLGLLVYLGALVFMAFGIGWGRCVFLAGNGAPGSMGLSSRYGWIVWPALGCIYFVWLLYGGPRWSRWGPVSLFVIAVALLPFNIGTGIQEGERHRRFNLAWEQSVREGLSADELLAKFPEEWPNRKGIDLLRKHHFLYYRPVPADQTAPPQPQSGERAAP